jgi:hypothetical protein
VASEAAMYIKEVSIDGFKSYAQRVCLSNFDPGFNAITGLNGSGKSNILDSLCFVMGIKNLSAVRDSSKLGVGSSLCSNSATAIDSSRVHCLHAESAGPSAPSSCKTAAIFIMASSKSAFSSCGSVIASNSFQPSGTCHAYCLLLQLARPDNCLQVRAANLQELVYKQGSAGITKATVSIVFHNNDPNNSPSGYEDKEYITVTRQVSVGSSG